MNIIKNIILMPALSIGISHAGTVPCNGFKINFVNKSRQNLVIDNVNFVGGTLMTKDSNVMGTDKEVLYTITNSIEGGNMLGVFTMHTTNEPTKELKLQFNLTNKNMICEVSNFSQSGTLNTQLARVLGGISLPIRN